MVKGFVKTLEASISVVLILSSVVFLFSSSSTVSTIDRPYVCLEMMEKDGSLRYYASNNMKTEMQDSLGSCIPPSFGYVLEICKGISCTSSGLPSDREIFLSSYIVAGQNAFDPAVVNLWVWMK